MSKVAFIMSPDLNGNKIFDISAARDSCLERFVLLKEKLNECEISCDTFDMCNKSSIDILICSDVASNLRDILKGIRSNPAVKVLYLPTEPPVIAGLHDIKFLASLPFDRVLFWNDAFISRYPHAVKCNIGQPLIDPNLIPFADFKKKKFLSAITLHTSRRHNRCHGGCVF